MCMHVYESVCVGRQGIKGGIKIRNEKGKEGERDTQKEKEIGRHKEIRIEE